MFTMSLILAQKNCEALKKSSRVGENVKTRNGAIDVGKDFLPKLCAAAFPAKRKALLVRTHD